MVRLLLQSLIIIINFVYISCVDSDFHKINTEGNCGVLCSVLLRCAMNYKSNYYFSVIFCYSAGIKKSYWITCNVEPDIQHLSLDRGKLPSNFVVRPRDLNRLLGNFQTTLQEITVIATEPNSLPSDAANEIGGKAIELRSYMDPTKGWLGFSPIPL